MQDQKQREKYLEDLALIKQTLREQEDRILVAPWAFYTWALVIIAATTVSMIIGGSGDRQTLEVAIVVWIPALLLGSVLETVGWIQYFRRDNRVLFTSANLRLGFSFVGVVAAGLVLVFSLLVRGVPAAGAILLLLAICFFLLAVFSFKHLFFEAYATLIAGTILTVMENGLVGRDLTVGGVDSATIYFVAGLLAALVFLAGGVHSHLLERRTSRRPPSEEGASRVRHG